MGTGSNWCLARAEPQRCPLRSRCGFWSPPNPGSSNGAVRELPGEPPPGRRLLAACRQGCAPETHLAASWPPMPACRWVGEAGGDRLSLLLPPGEKLMLPGKGGGGRSCGALCRSPPCGCGGAVVVMPGFIRPGSEPPPLLPGLAFFSCVGADANVTAGHGAEGLACGGAEGCSGKDARGERRRWTAAGRRGGEGRDADGQSVLSSGASTEAAKDTRASGSLRLGPTVGTDQLRDTG